MGTAGKLEHQASTRKMLSQQSSSDSVERQKRCGAWAEKWIAVMYTVVASLGYVSVGTMVAWSCNAFSKLHDSDAQRFGQLELTDVEELTQNQKTSLAATPALAAAVTSVVTYKLFYRVGTKLFMLTAATLMIGANFLLTFGSSFWFFSAGRILAGIGAGITVTLVPPYVDEFGSKQYKSLLDSILYVQFALGILVQLMSDLLPFTELASVVGTTFPIFLFIGFLFLPESARYLCGTQQVNRARSVLKRTHVANDALAAQIMENSLAQWQQPAVVGCKLVSGLRKAQNPRLVAPVLMLVVFQQFVGGLPMMFYLSRIFTLTDGQYTPEWTAIYVAAIFAGAIPAWRLVNLKIGDYKLLVWSGLVMAGSMAVLGWHCHRQAIEGHSDEYGHVPLVCYGLFIFLYAIGFQRLPWKWLDDGVEDERAFPVRTVATCISWTSLYLCVRILPFLIGLIGVGWVFWNITIVLVFAVLFVLLTVPNLDQSDIQSKTLANCSSSSSSVSNMQIVMEDVV
uniref:Facilitated trehalose transporter Tret1 n=2 Tax=Culex pipiens TaxID=7175 RepID=A0A8D8ATB7_CULPI